MIKINSQIFKILNKTLCIELNQVSSKNYFRQKLIYMKENKEIHSFIIEIYKGRINKYISFLNLENDGFYFEFLYISKKEENLIINQKITVDKKILYFNNIEKFENKLKGRLCFINISKQIIDPKDEQFNLDCNSFKYLFLIKDKNNISIEKFQLKLKKEEKFNFYMEKDFEEQLNKFYNTYKDNTKK